MSKKKGRRMLLDSDWMKSTVAAMIGAASTAAAFVLRQDRRITRVEEKVDGLTTAVGKIEPLMQKTTENSERLIRVETNLIGIERVLARCEDKIDRALTR